MALSRLPDSADAPLLTLEIYVYLSLHLHILHPPNSPEALKCNSDINNTQVWALPIITSSSDASACCRNRTFNPDTLRLRNVLQASLLAARAKHKTPPPKTCARPTAAARLKRRKPRDTTAVRPHTEPTQPLWHKPGPVWTHVTLLCLIWPSPQRRGSGWEGNWPPAKPDQTRP